jgi:hypothetical protein
MRRLVQFFGCAAPIEHGMYTAAACMALFSLMLRQRPRDGTAVLGALDQGGFLRTCKLKASLTCDDVRECQQQGIRQLIVSKGMTLDASAVAAAEESGIVEIVQCEHLLDVASHCFTLPV